MCIQSRACGFKFITKIVFSTRFVLFNNLIMFKCFFFKYLSVEIFAEKIFLTKIAIAKCKYYFESNF